MTFEDGSTQKFEGGEFDKKQGIYKMCIRDSSKLRVVCWLYPLPTRRPHQLASPGKETT